MNAIKELVSMFQPAVRIALLGALLAWGSVLTPGAGGTLLAQPPQQPQSPPEAANLFATAAEVQNNGGFDAAAEDWKKFIARYPQDPLIAKAKHYLGVCYVQMEKYSEAISVLDDVRKSYPKFELLEDSLLQLGWSYYKLAAQDATKFAPAAETFDALAKVPMGKHLDQALYFQGESYYQTQKFPEAIAAYDRLVKELPKSKLRLDALYALGVTLEETKKYEEAGKAYDLFLADYPQSDLHSEVRMRKAETILNDEKQPDRFATAGKIFAEVATIPDFQLVEHAMDRQAYCLARQEKFAEAGALYGRIVTLFPKSERINISTCQLSAGRNYYRAGSYKEASEWFAKSLPLNDDNAAEAAHWQCRIYLKEKKATDAVTLANEFVKKTTRSELLVPLKLDQADAYYEFPERKDVALDIYAKIATDFPDHALAPQALYNASFTALEIKKFDVAFKHATEFMTRFPQDKLLPDVKFVAAEAQLQQGKPAEAETVFRELVAKHGDHAEANAWRIRLGLALYLQKKYADVVATLDPLTISVPEQQAEAQYLVGVSHFYADKFAEAEKALARSYETAPKWRQADETLLVLSRSRRRLDNTKGAIDTVTQLIATFPESKLLDQAHYRLGEYQYALEDFKTALAEYDLVLKNYPQSTFLPFAVYGKGWSHLKLKEFAPATQAFTTLLEKYPEHSLAAETKFARSMSRRLEGNFQAAIDDAATFLATNPQGNVRSDALYERGLAEAGMNKNDAAVATFEQIIKEQPQYPGLDKVLYEQGWALKALDRNEPALACFGRLTSEFPASPLAGEAFFHVAEDLYAQKKFPEALASYEKAREKTTSDELGEKSLYKLAWSNYQLKQYEAAGKQFGEQLQKYPQGTLATDATFMQGESLFKDGKYADSLPILQKAIGAKLSNPAMEVLAYLHGGQAASQLKQWDEAIRLLGEVPKRFPESPWVAEARYETGFALQNAGKLDDALREYDIAAEKSRNELGARARFMSGEVFFTQKKYKEAVQEFQRGMFGFGGESAAPEVRSWQVRSAYEAGRCCEVQIASATDAAAKAKLTADARRFYTFAAEKLPDSPVGQEAKKRLEVLSKL